MAKKHDSDDSMVANRVRKSSLVSKNLKKQQFQDLVQFVFGPRWFIQSLIFETQIIVIVGLVNRLVVAF